MKLLDVNLLLYATNDRAPAHQRARPWFEEVMSSGEIVAMPWAVLMAFIRLTTNPRVLVTPLSAADAVAYIAGWRRHPTVTIPEPTDRHLDVLTHLLESTGVGGNLVSDAHLAALAIEHGATLCSADNDFDRFPGLDWINPLQV